MKNNDKKLLKKKSYKYDNFNNIIVENVDDLLYDKFYFNEEPAKSISKPKIISENNSIEESNDDDDKTNENNSKIKNKNRYINNLYIPDEIEIKRYKTFLKNNKKLLLNYSNKNKKRKIVIKENNTENSIKEIRLNKDANVNANNKKINDKDKDLKDETNINISENKYNQIPSLSINNNIMNNNRYNRSNSKILSFNSFNKNKDINNSIFLINNINFYNYYGGLSNFPKSNYNFLFGSYTKFKFKKKKKEKSDFGKEEHKFNYTKKLENKKINYYTNYEIAEKHCNDLMNCPVCQSNSLKAKLKEESMGIFKDKNKNDIRKIKYRKNMYSNLYNKRNMEKYKKEENYFSHSKIQQYQKKFCFFNSTKGIIKSNSAEEIKCFRPKTSKNFGAINSNLGWIKKDNKNNQNIIRDNPVILYYFK